ncbi:MAG: 6,7-dimethyl-8-ribityllumazine synthase [Micrococcales bacterium]|nr:6,7-dimethyl-8-ribityllumazine synthase [Micrococcales bacterium]
MSGGAGVPGITVEPGCGQGLRLVVVAAQWHAEVAEGLLAGALAALDRSGAEVEVIRVPGAFELPVATLRALQAGADAAVALGVVIQGETPHFEYVCRAATEGLTQVALTTGKAVGFGVLTVDDAEQAIDRAGLPHSREDKGGEAATAALQTALVLRQLAG